MKKPVVLLVLALAALAIFLGVRKPASEKAYRAFLMAVVQRDFAAAKSLTTMDEAALGKVYDSIFRSVPMQSLNGFSVGVSSREKDGERRILRAVPVIFFNPPGVESAMGALAMSFNQKATMVKTEAGWKVEALESTLLAVRDPRNPDRDPMAPEPKGNPR